MAQHDLLFYEKRSTPKVVSKGASFDAPEGYGKQTRRRAATAEEEKTIARGGWVRVDQSGKKGGESGYKKTKMKGREHLVSAAEPVVAAQLVKADYYGGKPGLGTKAVDKKTGGSGGGGGGRKVASKAGEKRYGLPIGTPLGQTRSKAKGDGATQASYDSFMAASTPADLRKAASWLSNDDLGRAAEALFSFDSKNERDEAGRIALVRELADRGIDPRNFGYRGGPVILNPNPKEDPTVKAAKAVARLAEQDVRKKESAAKKDAADRAKDEREQAATAKRAEVEAQAKAAADARKRIGDELAAGTYGKPSDLVHRS